MGVLSGIEPQNVLQWFEIVSGIPHGSGNTKEISDRLLAFANERGLYAVQDGHHNVIIRKSGTVGYEHFAPVILQGHMDMVCEKEAGVCIDFARDGLRLQTDGEMISAMGTTLGGDDGIALAYALAILDSDDIPHPPLEVIFTSDEEIGMLGAAALDVSEITGKRLINLDSEEEGCLLSGCAGGVISKVSIPVRREPYRGVALRLELSGLTGGHSGMEIDKGRANANSLLGRVLFSLRRAGHFRLVSVSGGSKDNAIPRESYAELVCSNSKDAAAISYALRTCASEISHEFLQTDPDFTASLIPLEETVMLPMDEDATRNVIASLLDFPSGVVRMSNDIPGLVQTSLNMGVVETFSDVISYSFLVRSGLESEKAALLDRLTSLGELFGGHVENSADYPAWEYRTDSPLREVFVSVFQKHYGKAPAVRAIHAGLECGLFAGKIPDLDAISLGPDISNVHTPKECMSIDSVRRTWKYLLEVLRNLKFTD